MADQFFSRAEVLCLECKEEIFNPLCPDCLSKSIMAWAVNYPKIALKLNDKIRKYLEQNKKFKGSLCLKCNKEKTFECPYCFTNFIYKELKKITKDKAILFQYLTYFNFDLEHTGYWKEKELLEQELYS